MVLVPPKPKEQACPECKNSNIIHDPETGEDICVGCGLVLNVESVVDSGPERSVYTPEQREARTRVGAPQTFAFHDKGLSTCLTRIDRDRYGNKISPQTYQTMYRLRKWQVRSRVNGSQERNLTQANAHISLLSEKLNLPTPVFESACLIYRKILAKNLVRGRSINDIAAAAIYYTCRKSSIPRSLKEIESASGTSIKCLTRSYRLIVKSVDNCSPPVSQPTIYITKTAAQLHISGELEGQAIRLLQKMKCRVGKDPRSLAAAALYIVCTAHHTGVTQKKFSEAIGVTEVTVRNRYKELLVQVLKLVGSQETLSLRANSVYLDDNEVFEKIRVFLNKKETS